MQVRSLDWEDPLEKEMAIHSSIFSPGESYGQRSLAGYSPWGHRVRHDGVTKHAAAAAAKSLQSCPTLCDPIDGSPPGSDMTEAT